MSEEISTITLSAQALSRSFGPRLAVSEVTLELKKGEVLGFLGPNGAGKTTTMRILSGNLAPSSGSVRICGIDLFEKPKAAKALIGYLPETPPLYRDLTVDEFLKLAARLHRVAKKQIQGTIARAKERCGLNDVGRQLIGGLSRGYRQRVGIAQAIVHTPEVVILDEPTVGLDPIQIREIRTLIRELGGAHSVILSTHILPEVETVCDRVHILHQGKGVYSGGIASLMQMRAGHMLQVGLRNPPPVAELERIAGVTAVEKSGDGQFHVRFSPETDPTDALVTTAVEKNWGLHQLNRQQASLEDVFVQLTQKEEDT
ncbi:MAG TPA: ATP-binding cassette domain-containing protein [Burkholderiales bacterium]|nr:ATP-binding cassette domain-containing protein [Burkholderiales bacterium]